MKLDKIKFAKLIAHCVSNGMSAGNWEIERIEELIDFDVPVVEKQYVSADLVDELLKQMFMWQKIPAIKAYRELCHAGLKESKDAVEKYWVNKGHYALEEEGTTLNDILHSAGRNKAGNDISGL